MNPSATSPEADLADLEYAKRDFFRLPPSFLPGVQIKDSRQVSPKRDVRRDAVVLQAAAVVPIVHNGCLCETRIVLIQRHMGTKRANHAPNPGALNSQNDIPVSLQRSISSRSLPCSGSLYLTLPLLLPSLQAM